MPTTLEIVEYVPTHSADGRPSAHAKYVCDKSEEALHVAALLRSVDPNNASLKCKSVIPRPLGGDPNCGKVELSVEFAPAADVDAKDVKAAFRYRLEFSSEAFTVSGKQCVWQTDNKPLANKNILPVQEISITDVVLFGTRASVNLATYDAYSDKVNSDTFLGAPAGYVKFESATAEPRTNDDGTVVFDVEVRLKRRSKPWNEFYNETTGGWDVLKVAGQNVYAAAAFSGLLDPIP